MGRVACIDYGLKRTGIALSDPSRFLASPLTTLQSATAKSILERLSEYDLDLIIVGHPLHMDGRISPMAKEAEKLVEELRKLTEVKIVLFDERLSTAQVDRLMRESGVNRKRRAQVADELAAVILLQTFLDTESAPS